MELAHIDVNITIQSITFKAATIFWEYSDPEEGYFSIGVPYQSANSEVLHVAYSIKLLLDDITHLHNELTEHKEIEAILLNFYKIGGVISFAIHNTQLPKQIRSLIDDDRVSKVLYCIFLLHKFRDLDSLFYLKHIKDVMQYFPSSEAEVFLADIVNRAFKKINAVAYIVKVVSIAKHLVKDASYYTEIVVWDLYQNFRSITTADKGALARGEYQFRKEFFNYYILYGTDASFFIKDDMKNYATGYAIALVLRKIGASAAILRPRLNTNEKFRTLIFLVCSRLLILNRLNYLHGDLHAGNFVLELGNAYNNFIQSEDLIIRNDIDLYEDFELIDFGKCMRFEERELLTEFISTALPNLYNTYQETIDRLIKVSPVNIAVMMTLIDLYVFIDSFYNLTTEYETVRETKEEYCEYIITKLSKYLEANSVAAIIKGGNPYSSIRDRIDEDMFIGGEPNPNYGVQDFAYNIDTGSLPIYKLMKHFYKKNTEDVDKSRVYEPLR